MSYRFSWEGSDFSSCTFALYLLLRSGFGVARLLEEQHLDHSELSGELLSFAFSWQVVALDSLFYFHAFAYNWRVVPD